MASKISESSEHIAFGLENEENRLTPGEIVIVKNPILSSDFESGSSAIGRVNPYIIPEPTGECRSPDGPMMWLPGAPDKLAYCPVVFSPGQKSDCTLFTPLALP